MHVGNPKGATSPDAKSAALKAPSEVFMTYSHIAHNFSSVAMIVVAEHFT